MNIRKIISQNDIKCVEKLAKIIWEEHFTSIIGANQVSYMLDKFLSYKAIHDSIKKNEYEFYGMYQDTTLFGFISVHKETELLFLSKLYIHKDKRGLGYASEAMSFLQDICKENKLKGIWLTCNKYNHNTLSIYKHLGFEIFDEAVNDIGNNYVMDDYYLRKWIL